MARKRIACQLTVALGLAIASAATPAVQAAEAPRIIPVPRNACTLIYQPVCGWKGGKRQTFGNSCVAGWQGVKRTTMGACKSG